MRKKELETLDQYLTCDAVFEPDETSKNSSQVSDDGRQDSNHAQGDEKARPAARKAGRWDEGEYYLEHKLMSDSAGVEY